MCHSKLILNTFLFYEDIGLITIVNVHSKEIKFRFRINILLTIGNMIHSSLITSVV